MGATNSTTEWSLHHSKENKYKNTEQTIPNAIERDHFGGENIYKIIFVQILMKDIESSNSLLKCHHKYRNIARIRRKRQTSFLFC